MKMHGADLENRHCVVVNMEYDNVENLEVLPCLVDLEHGRVCCAC